MEKNYSLETPIRASLMEMEVNDIVHFPIERLSVVRSTASTLGLEKNRVYTAKQNRVNKTVDVTRIS